MAKAGRSQGTKKKTAKKKPTTAAGKGATKKKKPGPSIGVGGDFDALNADPPRVPRGGLSR